MMKLVGKAFRRTEEEENFLLGGGRGGGQGGGGQGGGGGQCIVSRPLSTSLIKEVPSRMRRISWQRSYLRRKKCHASWKSIMEIVWIIWFNNVTKWMDLENTHSL